MKRICEICSSKNTEKIYKQKFVLSNENLLFSGKDVGYDVVVCKNCGFSFASNLPSPKKLEKFYKKNEKYAYKAESGSMPEYAITLHKNSSKFTDTYLKKRFGNKRFDISILDVGCGSGYLLNCFKEKGYKNIQGLDPAPDCRIVARKLYDIDVATATLSEYKNKNKFDLVILGSVLEHMNNLNGVVKKIIALLKKDGLLFLCVPDAKKFGTIQNEPFLEFSLEHINYFTMNNLRNLLQKYGFRNVAYESSPLKAFGSFALDSLWEPGHSKDIKIKYDTVGERKLRRYITISSNILEKVQKRIDKLVKTQENVIVWGVGSLTSRLLATTNLKSMNIQAYVDSSPGVQGEEINNIKISSPDILKNKNDTVFVSTYIHGKAIKKILLEKFHYKGKIILL